MKRQSFSNVRVTAQDLTLALLSGAGLAVVLTWTLYPYLGSGQEYTDLILGRLTADDYDKDREWRAFNMLWLAAMVFSGAMAAGFIRLRSGNLSEECLAAVRRLVCLAWLPALFWFGAALMRPNTAPSFMIASGVLVIYMMLIASGLPRYHKPLQQSDVIDIGVSSILTLVFGGFAALAGTIAGHFVSADFKTFLGRDGTGILIAASVIVIGLLNIANVYLGPSIAAIQRRFRVAMLILQIPIPLLLLVYVSKEYIYRGEPLIMHKSALLLVLLVGLLLASWFVLYRRYQYCARKDESASGLSYAGALSPSALFPIPIYLSWSQFSSVLTFSSDDFHIGEQLLPWQQIIDFGKLPYVEFVPVHGLMSIAYGGLNELFYGHTVATFPLAMGLLTAIAVGLTFLAIYHAAGPLPALALAPLVGGMSDRFYLLVPALLLFSHPKVCRHSKTWLIGWCLTGPLLVLYNAVVGIAIVVGSLPMTAYMIHKIYREDKRWLWRFVGVLVGVSCLVLIISPLRQMVWGFVHFVMSMSAINTISNAIGLFQHDFLPEGLTINHFQWNVLRLSWMCVAVAAVVVLVRSMMSGATRRRAEQLWFIALIPVTLFMIAPWALSRIDADILSRTGALSYVAVAFFVPLILVGFGQSNFHSLRVMVAALLVGIMAGTIVVPNHATWLSKPMTGQVVQPGFVLISGNTIGLPRLGEMFADQERVTTMMGLNNALQRYLEPGETYFDLTNRSALYFYLDMPVPALYAADYVAAGGTLQRAMLEPLRVNPPPVVLIAPRLLFDGGPVAFRSYLLYRQFIDSYLPQQAGQYALWIRPDRVSPSEHIGIETRMERLDPEFSAQDLFSIPNAWGRSWNFLQGRFARLRSLQPSHVVGFTINADRAYVPTTTDPHLYYDLSALQYKGSDIDSILLDYWCERRKPGPDPVLEIYWATDINSLSMLTSFNFSGTGKRALIPVGTQPRWRLAREIHALRIDLRDYQSCTALHINDVVLLKLN